MSNIVYLSAELHQQFGSIRTVGGQAAHRCAEVSQTGDGFAGLGGPTGPFSVAGAGCRTGGQTGSACCRQAHQPDQSPDVGQTERLQTCCKAAARATVWEGRKGGGGGGGGEGERSCRSQVLYNISYPSTFQIFKLMFDFFHVGNITA